MIQLHGKPININQMLLGRITFNRFILWNRSDLIFISKNGNIPSGYNAVITGDDVNTIKNQRIVKCVFDIDILKEGDIVTIETDGVINVIYEAESEHNSIFITERCNSNCIMCPQPPVKQEDDKFDLNLKLIGLINKKTRSLGITGGEPTLLGDKLFKLIEEIHKRIPKASINILSNGIRFENAAYAARFSKTLMKNDMVDIPLYSDIDNIHNSIVRTI